MAFEKEIAELKAEMDRIDADFEATKKTLGATEEDMQEVAKAAQQGTLEPELQKIWDAVQSHAKRDGEERAARFKQSTSKPQRQVRRQGAMRI